MMCKYFFFFIASVYFLILTYFLLFLFIDFYCAFAFRRLFGINLFLEEMGFKEFLKLGMCVVHNKMSGRELQMYCIENV